MARSVKEAEYRAKRNEILDAAMGLAYTKGYELMTIRDLMEELHISKGALYHYFDSKNALLEALIDRATDQIEHSLLAIVDDPSLSAVEKIQSYFDLSTQWKSQQRDLIVGAMERWYSDDNSLLRQKLTDVSRRYMAQLMGPVVRQGIEEKSFDTRYPAEFATIFTTLTMNLSDRLVEILFRLDREPNAVEAAQRLVDAYFDAIERILGARAGTFQRLNIGLFESWLRPSDPAGQDPQPGEHKQGNQARKPNPSTPETRSGKRSTK